MSNVDNVDRLTRAAADVVMIRVRVATRERLKRLQHEAYDRDGFEPTFADLVEQAVSGHFSKRKVASRG